MVQNEAKKNNSNTSRWVYSPKNMVLLILIFLCKKLRKNLEPDDERMHCVRQLEILKVFFLGFKENLIYLFQNKFLF